MNPVILSILQQCTMQLQCNQKFAAKKHEHRNYIEEISIALRILIASRIIVVFLN